MKIITPSERQEQRFLVQWLSIHAKLKHYYCKIDNEGKRTKSQGYNAKLQGLRSGVSDIFIYYPTSTYHGLWLEMKRNKRYTPSERSTLTWKSQEEFIEIVKNIGYAGYFCFGWTNAVEIINNYLLS